MKSALKIILAIIVTALIVGGGTYYVINQKNSSDQAKLQKTIDDLKSNITKLNQEITDQTSSTPTSTTTDNNCQNTDLSASLTNGDATAGTYYYTLNLKNASSTDCNYTGQTTASLLDRNDNSLKSVNVANTNLTIPAGQAIYSAVGFPDPNNYSGPNSCQSGVTSLAIYPPNQTENSPLKINQIQSSYASFACPGFSVGAFSLTKP